MNKKLDINNIAPGRPCRLLVENVYDTESVLLARHIVGDGYAVEVDGRIYYDVGGSGRDIFCVDELLVGEHPKFSLVEVRLVEAAAVRAKPAKLAVVRKFEELVAGPLVGDVTMRLRAVAAIRAALDEARKTEAELAAHPLKS
jgi:hypothetical protein